MDNLICRVVIRQLNTSDKLERGGGGVLFIIGAVFRLYIKLWLNSSQKSKPDQDEKSTQATHRWLSRVRCWRYDIRNCRLHSYWVQTICRSQIVECYRWTSGTVHLDILFLGCRVLLPLFYSGGDVLHMSWRRWKSGWQFEILSHEHHVEDESKSKWPIVLHA